MVFGLNQVALAHLVQVRSSLSFVSLLQSALVHSVEDEALEVALLVQVLVLKLSNVHRAGSPLSLLGVLLQNLFGFLLLGGDLHGLRLLLQTPYVVLLVLDLLEVVRWLDEVLDLDLVFLLVPETFRLEIRDLAESVVSPANGVLEVRDVLLLQVLVLLSRLHQDYLVAVRASVLPPLDHLYEQREILAVVVPGSVGVHLDSPDEAVCVQGLRVDYLVVQSVVGEVLEREVAFVVGN